MKAVVVGMPRLRERPESEHACRGCGQRKSRFYFRGVVKADRTHTLCFECYRAVVNHCRARRLAAASDLCQFASGIPGPAKLRGDASESYADMSRRRRRAQIAARHAVEGLAGMLSEPEAQTLQKAS